MDDKDFATMMQSTLGLAGIVEDQQILEAEQVMDGLIRFTLQLEKACDDVIDEMRGDKRPEELINAMMRSNVLASQFHADDLMAVNMRAGKNFSQLIGVKDAQLTAEASADVMVWLRIAGQTLIATKLLFQTSILYGRAPNGKLLDQSED